MIIIKSEGIVSIITIFIKLIKQNMELKSNPNKNILI